MAQPALPDDILHVLCEELANQDQFDTLFNCACASRTLAVPALTHLYRFVPQRFRHELSGFGSKVYADIPIGPIILLPFVVVETIFMVWHPPRDN